MEFVVGCVVLIVVFILGYQLGEKETSRRYTSLCDICNVNSKLSLMKKMKA